jgi:hypothetical protein
MWTESNPAAIQRLVKIRYIRSNERVTQTQAQIAKPFPKEFAVAKA